MLTTVGILAYKNMYNQLKIEVLNPYSAGIDFGCQNLTSIDVSKVDPCTVREKIYILVVDP